MAQQAKFVVFSGLFASQFALAVAPEWLIKKSFLQLWGGDFYNYRKNGCNILTSIMLPYFVKNCNLAKGLIFLIHGEENVFRSIIPLEHSRVYIAPMPGPPRRYEALEIPDKKINNKRILIGNSSTKENQHIDVFGKLGKNIQWNEVTDIEICSPLSYGDMMYKKKVETFGKRIFGNIFHSLDSFMPYDNYVQYLADCDVGIFNNNRQQAMGNIILLLRMGKKVYLNSHTSMWKHFQTIGCKVYDVDDLEHESVEEIFQFPSAYAEQNYAATTSYYSDENMVKQWEAIYDQVQE